MKSVQQMVSSFYTAKAVTILRKEINETESDKLHEYLIENLKIDEKSEYKDRVVFLIEKFSSLVGYQLTPIKILVLAIEDMFEYTFVKNPSVNTAVLKDAEYLNKTFGNDFVELKSINLLEHTLNVFEESLNLLEYYRSSQVVMPALGSLLHDFGKSENVRKEILNSSNNNSKEFKAHQFVSGLYVKNILKNKYEKKYKQNIDEFVNILSYIAENHHPTTKKIGEEFNISMVIKADHNARQKEISYLNSL